MDTIEVVGSGQSLVDAILKTPHMPTKYEYQPTPWHYYKCNFKWISKGVLQTKYHSLRKYNAMNVTNYRCFRIKEFQRCIICFSSLVTSTKSSSNCQYDLFNQIKETSWIRLIIFNHMMHTLLSSRSATSSSTSSSLSCSAKTCSAAIGWKSSGKKILNSNTWW